ncbi:MAG: DUF1844 domain-containing protein [Polyangiales bacterium]
MNSTVTPKAEPPADFTTFVLSLSTSALIHMGAHPDPQSGLCAPDPALARHSVELLVMLEQKTRGNLTGEEERLLAEVLGNLRTRLQQMTSS